MTNSRIPETYPRIYRYAALAALALASCHKAEPTPSAPVVEATAPVHETARPKAADIANEEEVAAGGSAADWQETASYRFRLDGVQPCGQAGADRLVGFQVRVAAKVNGLFVAPRDITVESAGVILDAQFQEPRPTGRCATVLPARALRAGQTARGFVVYRIPAKYAGSDDPVALAYLPTRWGGATRVSIKLRGCLESC